MGHRTRRPGRGDVLDVEEDDRMIQGSQPEVAHADDEFILIDELLTACRTYAVLAMTWCGIEP